MTIACARHVTAALAAAAITLAGITPALAEVPSTKIDPAHLVRPAALTPAERTSRAGRLAQTTKPPVLGPVTSLSLHQPSQGMMMLDLYRPDFVSGMGDGNAGLSTSLESAIWVSLDKPDPAKSYLVDCRIAGDTKASWTLKSLESLPPPTLKTGAMQSDTQHLTLLMAPTGRPGAIRLEISPTTKPGATVVLYGCDVTPAG